ncbi:hypothetical protein B0H14DRAFT_866152 [Mycena olivaceomarginata]|nr:hypothetical protein B0H14DRAFT_866152 [Mycena olivaceomarginata]
MLLRHKLKLLLLSGCYVTVSLGTSLQLHIFVFPIHVSSNITQLRTDIWISNPILPIKYQEDFWTGISTACDRAVLSSSQGSCRTRHSPLVLHSPSHLVHLFTLRYF